MSYQFIRTATEFPSVETKEETKREIEKSLQWNRGHVRGVSLKTDSFRAIQEMGDENAGDQVISFLKECGVELDIRTLKSYDWYPASYGPVLYLAAAHLFSWNGDDVVELGRISTRGSMLMKMIMRLVSVRATLRRSPSIWRKYYDFGELIPGDYSEEDQFFTMSIEGYDVHPINEFYHAGYFKGVIEMVIGSEEVSIEVVRSVYQGDPYSEYKITW